MKVPDQFFVKTLSTQQKIRSTCSFVISHSIKINDNILACKVDPRSQQQTGQELSWLLRHILCTTHMSDDVQHAILCFTVFINIRSLLIESEVAKIKITDCGLSYHG
jgi:hypothetical protein